MLALLVVGVIAPADIRATCGDYVHVDGKHTLHSDKPNLPPCSGLACSHERTLPPATAATMVVQVHDLCGVSAEIIPAIESVSVLHEPSPYQHPGLTLLVFHPPRS